MKRKLGQPLNLTDEQLDQMSAITDQDIAEAILHAQAINPRLAALLQAGTIVDGQVVAPPGLVQVTNDAKRTTSNS